jgi:3-oxoacyl-[acyl-carrier-protein] synthase I
MDVYLNELGLLSPAGLTKSETLANLLKGDRSGLKLTARYSDAHAFYLGELDVDLPEIPAKYRLYDCKNNRLLLAALEQIESTVTQMIRSYGADRVGVVIGTSTSGVRNTELALHEVAVNQQKPANFHYKQQQLGAGADFLAHVLNVTGPAYVVSTACSSSGKAFASARRLLELDLCDAVVVGGADTLCQFTVQGFDALESVSNGLCKPFGAHRDGINLSEAASLFVLSRQPGPVKLAGIGASSDAYHFSAPDPSGKAVVAAMQMALDKAEIDAGQVDYINLHGTATPLNDAMESNAVDQLFGRSTALSSSKGMTGHALGAAAALELGFCYLLLTTDDAKGHLIPNINDDELDDKLPPLNYIQRGQKLNRSIDVCQSNSFAFGGNNVSIVVTRG